MILDSKGRPLTRTIGFRGGLEVERPPRATPLASAIAADSIKPESADPELEESEPATEKEAHP